MKTILKILWIVAALLPGCAAHNAQAPNVAPIRQDSEQIRANVKAAKSDLQKIQDEADKLAQ